MLEAYSYATLAAITYPDVTFDRVRLNELPQLEASARSFLLDDRGIHP